VGPTDGLDALAKMEGSNTNKPENWVTYCLLIVESIFKSTYIRTAQIPEGYCCNFIRNVNLRWPTLCMEMIVSQVGGL
jgi:hypothetical protein